MHLIVKKFFSVSPNEKENVVILWLCLMHFAWGIASSMVFSLLPIFIVDELGGSTRSFGMLEGAVVFLSFLAKLFAGFIMDIFKRRFPMLKVGTILTVLSKLSLACAPGIFFVFIAKSIDRFAKGLRQAPSDAIFAELSLKKGFAYSLRYMMNLLGFFVGSIVTSIIVYSIGKNFRLIFALAIVPTLFAMYVLLNKVEYTEKKAYEKSRKHKWNIRDIMQLPREYWSFMVAVVLLMLSRFSEGFITLRAKEVLPDYIGSLPIFMSIYEACAITVAIPMGKLADRFDKRMILLVGLVPLFIADILGIFAGDFSATISIYLFAGLHMGATQGLLGAIIAKTAPRHLIGTAFAVYYAIDGLTLFLANNIAGISSNFTVFLGLQSSAGPFVIGAMATASAIAYIINWIRTQKSL